MTPIQGIISKQHLKEMVHGLLKTAGVKIQVMGGISMFHTMIRP